MKRCLILLLALLLTVPALAEQAEIPVLQSAREALETLGYPISDEAVAQTLAYQRRMQEWYKTAGIQLSDRWDSREELAYLLLQCQGLGVYDYDALTWSPTSERVYAFDAEFFHVAGMYTEFLQGIQAIMPEAKITAVREDLSGMDEDLGGSRKVYFDFNDHAYVVKLRSDGDWFNGEMIDFVNQVLETEGLPNRLHMVSDPFDQVVMLICGTEQEAAALRTLLGVEAPEADAGFDLLNWLGNLLGW
ncbi:MAG: hypothetical protein IJB81_11405 [Clostridia bacterium]|nr:hypothetical protein [Clostridia bacterium]